MRGDHTLDARILEMYETGLWSMEDIAKELNFSRTTVHRRLHAMGVEVHPRGTPGHRRQYLSYDEIELTRRLYAEYQSYAKVGRILGRSRESIRDRVKRHAL